MNNFRNVIIFLYILSLSTLLSCAQDAGSAHKAVVIAETTQEDCYRIPAIIEDKDGTLIVFYDYRYGKGDIGQGRIEIRGRRSSDGGLTWGEAFTAAACADNDEAEQDFHYAHGDAAVVCDSESGKILLMAASGSIPYWQSTRENPQNIGRYYSHVSTGAWECGEITAQIYDLLPDVFKAFFSSGRICQSKTIRTGACYRIYSALCTNLGSIVLYSDDFGLNWHPLGGADARPAPLGDESKVEILPNGNVLLSARTPGGGRYYNIFSYTDTATAEGCWGEPCHSSEHNSGVVSLQNACNGEILIVPAKKEGKNVHLALQSVPFGPGRTNVGFYYKELNDENMNSPELFAADWTRGLQVSDTTSAYSTMILDSRGKIDFLYENEEKSGGYDIVFDSFTVAEITGDAYLDREVRKILPMKPKIR